MYQKQIKILRRYSKMTISIKEFAKNFQTLSTEQLKTVIGGNGELMQPFAYKKKKPKF